MNSVRRPVGQPALRRFAVVIFVGALGAGCGALLGDLPTAGTLEAEPPGDEVSPSRDGAPAPGCALAHPPTKPDTAADSVSGKPRAYVLSHLAFPVGSNNEVGYDIDDTCTCDVASDGAVTPSMCTPRRTQDDVCDLSGGRDNATSKLVLDLFVTRSDGAFDVGYDLGAKYGAAASMFVIDEYSGLPNDPQVLVTYYESPGLESAGSVGCAGDAGVDAAGDGGARPTWSGCDTWKVSKSSLPEAKVPVFLTRQAYVSGGVLVARFSSISFRIGAALLRMTDPVVTARMTNDQTKSLTGGVIAGRVDADDFVRAFGELELGEAPLCRQGVDPTVTRECAGIKAIC